jgi:glycosyltransferase involved in cell wall biosynthesis
VGGIPDVSTAGEALLIRPDDPSALADAIRRTLVDPILAGQRVVAARKRLDERFAAEPWLAAYETLYRLVAKGKGP